MRLDGERWRAFFDAFQHTAFRLETYPAYGVTSEREEYEGFLSSGCLSIPDDDSWLVRVRHFRATGRWIGRVHVLRKPLTDYLRYEFAVYCHTVAAGGDIRILDLTGQPDPGLPSQDFWLFDETSVVRMDYDDQGAQFTESTPDSHMAASKLMVDEADELYAVRDGKPAVIRLHSRRDDIRTRARQLPVRVIWPDGAQRG